MTKEMTKNIQAIRPVIAGVDLGNGYVKAVVDKETVVYPSVASKQFNVGNDVKLGLDEVGSFMKTTLDVINNMDLSFVSPLVKDTTRRIFGERAMTSGGSFEEFDVYSRQSKADVDLSGVLVLSTLAACATHSYYQEQKTLPSTPIKLHVDLATALPISEFKTRHKLYRQKYLNNGRPHVVTFHNFEQPFSVELIFDHCYISNEGEAAQYGLMFGTDEFLDMIGRDARKRFVNGELDEITGRDLVHAKNTVGVDIGEGTIDFAVFTNGRFNSDASSSLGQGYGNVLESALSVLQNENYPYKSRKELSEFLNVEPSVLTRKKWNHVKAVSDGEAAKFSDVVTSEVSKVYNRVGAFIEVIFVYGGGATPLEASLFGKLQELIQGFGSDQLVPIVYLDSGYSRFLNVHGLYKLAERLR